MPRIRIVGPVGVVGEDRTDWLPCTEHEASDAFAAHLIRRHMAVRCEVADAPLAEDAAAANAAPQNHLARPARHR